jgi:beta-glucosidase
MNETLDIKDIRWGASTAGHQSGDNSGIDVDWVEFEKRKAEEWAEDFAPGTDFGNGPIGEDIYERMKSDAKNPDNYISGKGTEWADGRYKEDLDIAKDLGLESIRFSIERSRVEVSEGEFSEEAIKYYKSIIKECRKRGIEPMITLFHFTNPTWFSRKGGWEDKESAQNFSRYVGKLLKILDEDIKYIIVINEPDIYTLQGYVWGNWPPEKKYSLINVYRVRKNLIEAHKSSFDLIKGYNSESQVSSAVNLTHFEPKTPAIEDYFGSVILEKIVNEGFLPYISGHMNFIAINCYFHCLKKGIFPWKGLFENDEQEKRSDLGIYINPISIYKILLYLHGRYPNLPIEITENGVADRNDTLRPDFIRKTLYYVAKAIHAGVPVRSYYHWSLTDNFEWDKGFAARFGLIGIDYETQKRTVRESARVYQEIIRSGRVSI